MICVIRMNPACSCVRPKLELPNVLLPWSARTFTRLNRFSISILTCALLLPKRRFLMNTASTLYCGGVRTSVIVRGALPQVNAGAAVNAGGLLQVGVGGSAGAGAGSELPGVPRSAPGAMLGAGPP